VAWLGSGFAGMFLAVEIFLLLSAKGRGFWGASFRSLIEQPLATGSSGPVKIRPWLPIRVLLKCAVLLELKSRSCFMDSVDLSVIVCTLNRSSLLKKCLGSLAAQQCRPWRFEVVVVDNGSTDDTRLVAKEFSDAGLTVKYIFEARKCIGHARNIGLQACAGRYVATLDDDTIPSREWCTAACETFDRLASAPSDSHKIVALGGPIDPVFELEKPSWLTPELEIIYGALDLGEQIQHFRGAEHPVQANVVFLRDVLASEPWNDQLLMWEENELFGRLTRKGYTFLYVPAMRVRHFISAKRLDPEWLLNRYFADGVASRCTLHGFREKIRSIIRSAARLPYEWARSHFGPEGAKLTFRCRTMFHAGSLAGLLSFRDADSTAYVTARKNATA
jgi:glucosyl-dolichyl phosphate glucuronosyltransferase